MVLQEGEAWGGGGGAEMGAFSEADAHQHRADLDQSRSVWSLACSWDLRMIGLLLPSGGDSLPLCFSGAPGIIFITQWTFFTSFFSKSKTLCLPALLHGSGTSQPQWPDLG